MYIGWLIFTNPSDTLDRVVGLSKWNNMSLLTIPRPKLSSGTTLGLGFLLALVLGTWANGASGASSITFVKEVASTSQASYTYTNTLSLTVPAGGVAQGDTIILFAGGSTTGNLVTSVTDTKLNIYTIDAQKSSTSTSVNTNIVSAYMTTGLSPGDTIKVTYSTTSAMRMVSATEWSGIAPTGRLDKTATNQGGSATLNGGTTAVTTQASELVVGSFGGSVNGSFTPGPSYTAFPTQLITNLGSTYRSQRQEYKIVSTTGAYQATGTSSVADQFSGAIATYKADASAPDNSAPSIPGNLSETSSSATTITIGWNPSTDNVGVTGYGVYDNSGTVLGTTQLTSYTFTGLACGQAYIFGVDAYDGAGNHSAQTPIVAITSLCPPPDTTPPTVTGNTPSNGATNVSTTSAGVTATFSEIIDPASVTTNTFQLLDSNNQSVSAIVSLNNQTNVATLTPATNLAFSATYTATVKGGQVKDIAGNALAADYSWSFTTAPQPTNDTAAPSTPTALVKTTADEWTATLSWNASTDNVGVVGYDIYESSTGGPQNQNDGRVSSATAKVKWLDCGTPYTFGVDAYDAAGNHSAQTTVTFNTPNCNINTVAPVTCPAGHLLGNNILTQTDLPPTNATVPAPYIPSSPHDFTPTHPFVFMTPNDIQIMRDNVNVKKLPWAVDLFNKAKADADANMVGCAKLTDALDLTTGVGVHMLSTTLVYLITGDTSYADAATSWLLAYANAGANFNTSFGNGSPDLSGIHLTFGWTYDLMYNYLAANRPGDLATITNWLAYYMNSLNGNFTINTAFNGLTGKAVLAYVLGKGSVIDDVANQFQSWYSSMPGGYYGDVWSGQAFKNYDITLETIMDYAITTHNATQAGYSNFDALTWQTPGGFNLVKDHWRTMVKYSTPQFQVPFQTIWRGPLFSIGNGTAVTQELYAVTHDPEWGTIVQSNPSRTLNQAVDSNWETIDSWPGLTHGREVDNGTGIRNDSINNTGRGFAMMDSGDPNGVTTSDTLQAYLMHGSYGAVEPLNLKIYGKGQKLTQEHDDDVNNVYGERGSGGIYVTPLPAQNFPASDTTPASSNILLWDINPDIKIIGADYTGQGATALPNYARRAVAVTNDYFLDVYDINQQGNSTYNYIADGVGPASTYATINGSNITSPHGVSTSSNFSVTWPNHMQLTMVNNVASQVTINSYNDLPPAITYPTDPIQQLGVNRTGASAGTKYVGVYEPFGQGGAPAINSIQSISPSPSNITALKISASGKYYDYIAYESTVGSYNAGTAPESISVNGRYGYIRYDLTIQQVLVDGSIPGFTIYAPTVSRLCIGGITATYSTNGGYITYPGAGNGVAGSSCAAPPPPDTIPPTAPTNLAQSNSTNSTITLTWSAATDNVGVSGYGIYNSSSLINSTQTASYTLTGLTCGQTYSLSVDAYDAAGNRSPPVPISASTSVCDNSPPTVNLTSPTNGSQVSGIQTLSASATDDIAVANVRYQVDGSNFGSPITTSPYSLAWNTTTVPNGSHTITAIAFDAAGNQASSSATVNVNNVAPAIAFVKDLGTSAVGNSGATMVLTVPSGGVAQGHTVVLWAATTGSGGTAIASVTDNRGNTYRVDSTLVHPNTGLTSFIISSYITNPLLAGDKITASISASFYSGRLVGGAEFSGLSQTNWLDMLATSTGHSTAPASALSALTSQPTELVIGGIGSDTTATFTPGSGYTSLPSTTISLSGVTRTLYREYKIVASAGQYKADGVLSTSSYWTSAVTSYH